MESDDISMETEAGADTHDNGCAVSHSSDWFPAADDSLTGPAGSDARTPDEKLRVLSGLTCPPMHAAGAHH